MILEDLEQKVMTLRALQAKLHDFEDAEKFGGVVAAVLSIITPRAPGAPGFQPRAGAPER